VEGRNRKFVKDWKKEIGAVLQLDSWTPVKKKLNEETAS
jgi:hypothetical protein